MVTVLVFATLLLTLCLCGAHGRTPAPDTAWCRTQRLLAASALDQPQRDCNVEAVVTDAVWTLRRLFGNLPGIQELVQCQFGSTDTWTYRCIVSSKEEADRLSAEVLAKLKESNEFDYRTGAYLGTATYEPSGFFGLYDPMLTFTFGRCPSDKNNGCYDW